MKLNIYPDKETSSKAAADLIVEQIRLKPDSLVCFPSGDSPTLVLKYLVAYGLQGAVNFAQCRFVGLDEWIGMDENDEGSCRHYLNSHFFLPLNIKPDKIVFFNGLADHVDDECARMNDYILKNGPIDIMMVGLGMNGHIGLNEPGTDFNLYAHRAELDPLTVKVAQKYFQKDTALTGGLTLGLQHFTEAKTAILIISGSKKADILVNILEEKVTSEIPGTIIQLHSNAIVFSDQDAASKLTTPTSLIRDQK
ncbi:glucosamine-6-phosphate deaminase [Dyadobacter sp. LHD-138]|uniref:glucosamine-6-phosphate deaminase n=1 Tax=Dyadobacter sp. LHD-138 TaxID=3071413 RepID=UPI0027E0E71C|nr:glucosamine-6-phosphate deaminase [Dyadobacter sp. LHD-138]MDQ6480278.1 glucosamine-6-phosphate deaminase [Dyadobacter sp. LHD-138]